VNLSATMSENLCLGLWISSDYRKETCLRLFMRKFFIDGNSLVQEGFIGAQFNRKGSSINSNSFSFRMAKSSYFDINGNSLRKAFLKSSSGNLQEITSHFSSARMHPILRIIRPHYGVDLCCSDRTP